MITLLDNFVVACKEKDNKLDWFFAYVDETSESSPVIKVIKKFDDLIPAIDFGVDFLIDMNQEIDVFKASEIRELITDLSKVKDIWEEYKDDLLTNPESYLIIKTFIFGDPCLAAEVQVDDD